MLKNTFVGGLAFALAFALFASMAPEASAQWGYGPGYRRSVRLTRRYARTTFRVGSRRGYGYGWNGYSYGSGGSYGYSGCDMCDSVVTSYCSPCAVATDCSVADACGGCSEVVVDAEDQASFGNGSHHEYGLVLQSPYRNLVAQRIDSNATAEQSPTDNKLRLTVHVPADAKVFINNKPTTTTGTTRRYVTPAVDPKLAYVFSIRAEVTIDGKKTEKTQEIRVLPNAPSALAFQFTEPQESMIAKATPLERYREVEEPAVEIARHTVAKPVAPALPSMRAPAPGRVARSAINVSHKVDTFAAQPRVPDLRLEVFDSSETVITLAVPADAQVFLGGIDTMSQGADRRFTNSRLKAGQTFKNYHVLVKYIDEAGETVTLRRTVDLTGGKRHHLSIGAEELKVAAR